MKGIIKIIILSFLLVSFPVSGDSTIVDYTIPGPSGVDVAWDPGDTSPVDFYEVRVHDDDRNTYYGICSNVTTVSCKIDRVRSGHFTVLVRACLNSSCLDSQGVTVTPCCSLWALSTDATKALRTDGTPGGWRIYWKPISPGKPGPPGIPHF